MDLLTFSLDHLDLWRPLAGLGLFLFAMDLIETGLEGASGPSFQRILRRNTHKPVRGMLTGTTATALLQSSSLVGLLMLALVGAGIVSMRNALSVMLGANLGTTATGWLVATFGFQLDLHALALPLIAVGAFAALAWGTTQRQARTARRVHWARVVFGIGLLLLGLEFMKSGVTDLSASIRPQALAEYAPIQFLAFGLIFSALVQSSSATMMVTLSALYGGIIELPAAAAVAIGADLGTTSTVLLGAMRGSAAKKRLAAGHGLFNLITNGIAFVLLQPLLALVKLLGLADVLTLVAFHSVFNLMGILLFLPGIGRFADWLEHRFHDSVTTVNRHLANASLRLPETATEAIELETQHLLQRVIRQGLLVPEPSITLLTPTTTDTAASVGEHFESAYSATKRLEGEIIAFAADAGFGSDSRDLNDRVARCVFAVREATHAAKSLKDAREDLLAFHRSSKPTIVSYGARFRHLLQDFSAQLLELDLQTAQVDQIVALQQASKTGHDNLHNLILTDVRADQLDADDVSSLLNVNRELVNANRAMINAISMTSLSAEQVEALDRLPA